jgi:hypothetical protein
VIGDRYFVAIACALAITPVAINVAAGGRDYKPTASGNPCDARTWAPTHSLDDVLSQAALSALDGAACQLHVPAETLGLALTSDSELAQFKRDNHLSKADVDDAARSGLNRAVDDGENSGSINAVEAFALRLAVRGVPVDRLLQLVRDHLYG